MTPTAAAFATMLAATAERDRYEAFYGAAPVPANDTLWSELSGAWLDAAHRRLEQVAQAARLMGV